VLAAGGDGSDVGPAEVEPVRRTRIRPMSAKRRKRDAALPREREAAYARSQGRCEAPVHAIRCNGRAEECHHMAGRRVPDPHRRELLLWLSKACHDAATANGRWAIEAGLSVSRIGVWDDEGEPLDGGGS
jgi:hypothetical protein